MERERRVELVRGSATWVLEVTASVDVSGTPVEDLVVRIDRGTGATGYMVLVSTLDGSFRAIPIEAFVIGGGAAVAQFGS